MHTTVYHFQLVQLLRRFNDNLFLSPENAKTSFEFLFGERKVIPFEAHPDLADLLYYLKDNMLINNLTSFEQLLKHYAEKEKDFEFFLQELTSPTPGGLCVLRSAQYDLYGGAPYKPSHDNQWILTCIVNSYGYDIVSANIEPHIVSTILMQCANDNHELEAGRGSSEPESCLC